MRVFPAVTRLTVYRRLNIWISGGDSPCFCEFFCVSSTWEILLVVGSRKGLGMCREVWNSAEALKTLGEILEKLYELSRR